MAFFKRIFVRRFIHIWKHCPRRPRVTADFYHQHFFVWRATSSLKFIHLRRVVQQKNQFFIFQILDRGQKYLIKLFLQLSNSLKQTIWVSHFDKIKFHHHEQQQRLYLFLITFRHSGHLWTTCIWLANAKKSYYVAEIKLRKKWRFIKIDIEKEAIEIKSGTIWIKFSDCLNRALIDLVIECFLLSKVSSLS